MSWQPISEAPEQTVLVAHAPSRRRVIATKITSSTWVQFVLGVPLLFQPVLDFEPSHWMPLPEPPQ